MIVYAGFGNVLVDVWRNKESGSRHGDARLSSSSFLFFLAMWSPSHLNLRLSGLKIPVCSTVVRQFARLRSNCHLLLVSGFFDLLNLGPSN